MTARQVGVGVLTAISLLLPLGCRNTTDLQREDLIASKSCSSLSAYFPLPDTGTGNLFYGTDQAEWEGNLLQHMKEPALYACPSSLDTQPVYRFLWDRSLSKPIAVRLTVHADGSGTLFVRE